MDYQEPVKHFYCEVCQQYSTTDNVCTKDNCRSRNAKMLEFYDLQLEQQLKSLFKDDMGRFTRTPKERLQHGADMYLTFTMNTDGVSLFSSTNGALWPVYLAVNELPIRLRFSRKYLIVCYLHCQVEKPNMLTYLTPLMTTLERLHSTDPGEYPEGMPLMRYYLYKDNSNIRTHQSMLKDAQEALRTREPVNGIKGASPLMVLSYEDLPKVFVIDWMHNVLLGVTKALLNFWLNYSYKNSPFYVGDKITLLDQRLLRLQIPDFVSRRQRSLHDHSHWKASECREWIHFSVPVLLGVLIPTVFFHYVLLTTAMSLLTKDGMTQDDINLAEDLLKGFCEVYPKIYGKHKQTMNVHLLRHLAQFTRLFGPLFNYSCFGFESMNSYLKRMVCFAVSMSKQIATMVRQLTDTAADSSVKQLAKQLGSKIIVEEKLTNSESLLEKLKPFKATDEYYDLLPEDFKTATPSPS